MASHPYIKVPLESVLVEWIVALRATCIGIWFVPGARRFVGVSRVSKRLLALIFPKGLGFARDRGLVTDGVGRSLLSSEDGLSDMVATATDTTKLLLSLAGPKIFSQTWKGTSRGMYTCANAITQGARWLSSAATQMVVFCCLEGKEGNT